jgi:hypothetical protein
MNADEAIANLEKAFAGVTLGNGISLRQAELIDDMSYKKDERWESVRQLDVVDDWKKIPKRDLEDLGYLAHVDAEGFRYYIPALLSLFARSYDPIWIHVVQVLVILSTTSKRRDYLYSLLTTEQKAAIAEFLVRLPSLVNVSTGDAATIEEALQVYWGQFLKHEEKA